MNATRPVRDDDFLQLSDEELVVLVRVFGWSGAWDSLLKRCEKWFWEIIPGNVRIWLPDADLDDLVQVGRRATVEAVNTYRLEEIAKQGGCRFRSYFGTLAKARLQNHFRDRERYDRHRDPRARWEEALDQRALHMANSGSDLLWSHEESSDPVVSAEKHEFFEHLDAAVSRLSGTDAILWKHWWDGSSASESARQAGISESTVRRKRKRLLARISPTSAVTGPIYKKTPCF